MKRAMLALCFRLSGVLSLAAAAYSVDAAYGMDCPKGMFGSTDAAGIPTCRGFNTGETDVVQTDPTVSIGHGALPGLDRWGTEPARRAEAVEGDVDPNGIPNCPMGSYGATDLEGNATCKNWR